MENIKILEDINFLRKLKQHGEIIFKQEFRKDDFDTVLNRMEIALKPKMIEEVGEVTQELFDKVLQGNDKLITIEFLMEKHPELLPHEAKDLLQFANNHTIYHQYCYGDGQIMYPMYKEYLKTI